MKKDNDVHLTMDIFDQFVQVCDQYNVIPMIVALFRQSKGSHYQVVRFADRDYENFLHCEPVDYHHSIRDRLDRVHEALGWAFVGQSTIYEFDIVPAVQTPTLRHPRPCRRSK